MCSTILMVANSFCHYANLWLFHPSLECILKCIPHALNTLTTDLADAKSLFQLHLLHAGYELNLHVVIMQLQKLAFTLNNVHWVLFKPAHVIAKSYQVDQSDCSDFCISFLFVL